MSWDYEKKTYLELGQRVLAEMPYSEACMHLEVAGKVMLVELQPGAYAAVAQLFTPDGNSYSFPITYGEAGIYWENEEGGKYYHYPPKQEPNAPEWTKYKRVDEMIECFPISDATQKALLEAMPDAYGGEAPGEDDWPEPDAKRDEPYKLCKIWEKLSPEVRQDLQAAYDKEMGRFA